eukprot:CAMPEP_0118650808 /NCGR_PEP_ID=MMETSP0785-20121206/10443_1 /TAXON_ID=91992 /ORGANISM="Bolidomonas pacifica, Strain CCMP 1866" /LENGTH=409 /DNA_ID=CAMNT_0006543205 /DNA_START=198 /DNA_END=1424 /DNA_ORIENTATION=-
MSYNAQDSAFFGSSNSSSSSSPTPTTQPSSDELYARRLQEQLDLEDRLERARRMEEAKGVEERDEAFAKMVQEEEEGRGRGTIRDDESKDESKDETTIETDAMLAKRLYEEDKYEASQPSTCPTCGVNVLSMRSTLTALNRTYCNNGRCFICSLCGSPITTSSYQVAVIDGERVPCHKECYVEAMVPRCVVCRECVPEGGRGSYVYSKHPYFQDWRYCGGHEVEGLVRCTGCDRMEPKVGEGWHGMGDGRKICGSCVRTVVMDSEELKPLFSEVLSFLTRLGLCVWPEMNSIPILSVSFQTLNERSTGGGHDVSNGPVTRGLCMTETESSTMGLNVPTLTYNRTTGGFDITNNQVRIGGGKVSSYVTAILVLSGLPRHLTCSILAHESIHAYLKLHPSYSDTLRRTGGI